MTILHPLDARITHKYVGTYAHLDQWEPLGKFEVVASSEPKCTDPEDMCDPQVQTKFLKVMPDLDAGATDEEIRKAIEDTFTKHDCHHDYNCCGCRSYYAKAKRAGEYWAVTISSSRNF